MKGHQYLSLVARLGNAKTATFRVKVVEFLLALPPHHVTREMLPAGELVQPSDLGAALVVLLPLVTPGRTTYAITAIPPWVRQ